MCVSLVRVDSNASPDVGFALRNGDDVVAQALASGDILEARDATFTRILKHFGLAF
jgi:hypothetical protein